LVFGITVLYDVEFFAIVLILLRLLELVPRKISYPLSMLELSFQWSETVVLLVLAVRLLGADGTVVE